MNVSRNSTGNMKTLSHRQKTKWSKGAEEKLLLAKYREIQELWRDKNSMGTLIPVEPFQQGWIRKNILRWDISRRSDAHKLRRILDVIGTITYCRRKDFRKKNHKGVWEDIHQVLKPIQKSKWDFPDDYKKYFTLDKVFNNGRYLHDAYHFKNDWMFECKILPHMITHVRIPNAEAESKKAKLYEYLDQDSRWDKLNKLLGVSDHSDWDRRKEVLPEINYEEEN